MADVANARPVSGAAATIEHGFDDGYEVVPAELEETPAGAALAAVLERIDPRRVSPSDTVRLVAAQRRQLAHQQACFHACAREAALAGPDAPGGRAERDGAESGDELRAVLSASRTAVARLLDLADAAQRHPRLGAAWRAGEVDEQRVAILVRWTAALSVEHAAAVIAELIDQAGAMTPSRLIDRIQALAKALDPAWAEKLYRQARRQRRVRARCTDAGTVNLSALDLPMPGGVRSVRRINALAARSQAAGRPGLIDTIRADVVLALFHPDNAGADDAEIVAAVLAMGHDDDPRPRRVPDPAQAPPDDPTPPADPTPTDAPTPTSTPTPTPTGDPTPPGSAPPHAADPAVGTDDALGATGGRRPTRQSRFELRVGLNTLLELDERPARLPGWGVITAGLARELAAAHADAEWRVAVTDDSGVLIAALLAGRRPAHTTTTPQQPPLAGAPRPVVELHVSEAGLARLRPREHDGWAPFLTDLQQQLSRWRAAHDEDLAAQEAERRAAEPERPWDDPLDVEAWARIAARRRARAHEALARFPSAALRRWITMRDRSCVFPPCGASALAAEIDHTRAVTDHGRTLPANLGPACGHDHDLKDRGWTLNQPRPGWFRWTSPTGHTYERGPRPVVDDLPAPRPPTTPSSTEPPGYADDGPAWDSPPPSAPAAPPPPPAMAPEEDPDPPPF